MKSCANGKNLRRTFEGLDFQAEVLLRADFGQFACSAILSTFLQCEIAV